MDPVILSCTDCGQEIYRATPESYSKEACEKAGRDHERDCPKRKEATALRRPNPE
ncbi:MAG TPA: hypothetical protein VED24_04115 [Candidatus Acidoferrum sp.]|nr:hypothetical protein [Candidatus Acidoferrum sp.]